MISRFALACSACSTPITARIQIGHEERQRLSAVCPACFAPFSMTLDLSHPPHIIPVLIDGCRVEEDNNEAAIVANLGTGYVISRGRLHDDAYFPVFDMPEPTKDELAAFGDARLIDLTVALGGLPDAQGKWRLVRNAYRHARLGRFELCQQTLSTLYPDEKLPEIPIEAAIVTFLTRTLHPCGMPRMEKLLSDISAVRTQFPNEFERLRLHFQAQRDDRLDDYMEVFQHFFRAYDEFNQTLIYVRRGIDLPEDPYAPSSDFDNTKLYYGEAFESLGAGLDFAIALNNVASGRAFDKLRNISLQEYRRSDKGRRGEAIRDSDVFEVFVEEYDNQLRNASHHRWLRLSDDRSEITYRIGGTGERRSLSYATYLLRCDRITMSLMLLASLELLVLH
ncbi:zinc ribbon domain-containing protein [Luteibacter sp. 22Crub2.1]|uniref:zinc ribbon domain-containing protein n=1 Tax=Luteibacter sp. 22Crub2.1 TaxID=1283288 RepID=UPI0009CAF16A|nr:zinc ribbon domain-containing protein [Luteibacter sp. 22Crub2.1]SKB69404.1 hypothetical protein SAMN05660880_02190 [Luteibacter sp. 22Crub2.1]